MRKTNTASKARQIASAVVATLGSALLMPAHAAVSIHDLGLSESQKDALVYLVNSPVGAPGISFGSPVGFGLSWGAMGFTVAGQTLTDGARGDSADVDGSAAIGFGVGDAAGLVGFESTLSFNSISDNVFEEGAVNFKLHTALPGKGTALAVGVENVLRFGDATRKGVSSAYAVATKVISLNPNSARHSFPLSINVGIGDNRFESNRKEGVGFFGSLGLFVHRQVSTVVDWSGRDLSAAVSVAPFRRVPMTVTLGAVNLAERRGNETQFSGAIGYRLNF